MPNSLTKASIPTPARLSLGNTSPTISTADHLRFQLDHAQARDAVHAQLDVPLLEAGLRAHNLQPIHLRSAAPTRALYLRRPDLGRTLHPDSITALQTAVISTEAKHSGETPVFGTSDNAGAPRLASETWVESPQDPRTLILLADGLSSLALERHALPLLDSVLPLIPDPLPLIPILTNARVALADPIGTLLHAGITILLIGERPGLSSPDSLGVYITWQPRSGRTDAERNCISNIRGDAGLSYAEAAHRIAHYIREATRHQTTGIALKDPDTTLLSSPSL